MKLLLPPGLGDLHWVMLKMRSFMETHGVVDPEVYVCSTDPTKNRARGYIELLPFVKWGGYVDMRGDRATFNAVFRGGEWKQGYRGFDHFFGCNNEVRLGLLPQHWWPKMMGDGADYDYPITIPPVARPEWNEMPDHYVLVSFYKHLWYGEWSKAMPPFKVIEQIRRRLPDAEIIITGAEWDRPHAEAIAKRNSIRSLAGETTVEELLFHASHAVAWVGHTAGNGMLAAHLGTPTILLWGEPQFKKPMWRCWAMDNERYIAVDVNGPVDNVRLDLENVIRAKALQEVRARQELVADAPKAMLIDDPHGELGSL